MTGLKNFYLICALTISTSLFPIFDLSPWIVVNNATKLDFVCQIEAVSYELEIEQALSFLQNCTQQDEDGDFYVIFEEDQNSDKQNCMKMTITITCKAEQAIKRDRMFDEDKIMLNIKILSVSFTHESLQITTSCNPINFDQRYFSIEYQADYGIITKAAPIALYIKFLSNFKQATQSLLATMLNATNWLPY